MDGKFKVKDIFFFIKISKTAPGFISLILVALLRIAFEYINVMMFIPFINLVQNPEIINQRKIYVFLKNSFGITNELNFIFLFGIFLLTILLITPFTKVFSEYITQRNMERLKVELVKILFSKYINKDYNYYTKNHSSKMLANLSMMSNYVGDAIGNIINLISKTLLVFFLIVAMININPIQGLSSILFVTVAYFISIKSFSKFMKKIGEESASLNRDIMKIEIEAMHGFKEIKMIGNENDVINNLFVKLDKLKNINTKKIFVREPSKALIEFFIFGGIISFILFSMRKTSFQEVLPVLTSYAFAGYKMMPNINQVFESFVNIKMNVPFISQVKEEIISLTLEEVKIEVANIVENLGFKKTLTLKNIEFRYSENTKQIIKNLNLEIKKNSKIGIIGKTGSGKSTLIDIICRLLYPNSGKIYLDDVEIEHKNETAYRKLIGYVPQSIYLSDTSIKENIAMGFKKEDIDMQLIKKVSIQAGILDFIYDNKDGFDAKIGERGIQLSGGQKQRIAIARALYRQPQIIVFDEATSSLDTETEKDIVKSITSLEEEVTLIMIAHRLVTLEKCDIIYKIENGNIIKSYNSFELIEGVK